jgi:hypothetical protein
LTETAFLISYQSASRTGNFQEGGGSVKKRESWTTCFELKSGGKPNLIFEEQALIGKVRRRE